MATSTPGATEVSIQGLTTTQPLFFVVRARDISGNTDHNTHEVSASGFRASFLNNVWPIVLAHCQFCHTIGTGAKQVPDMILSSPSAAFLAWVNVSASCPDLPAGSFRVRPGDSANSFLWQKISMTVPPCGQQMPLLSPPLSLADQETIRDWINEGAQNN